jgi:hypothetical protein
VISPGACSVDKFIVSGAGGVYGARDTGPNRRFVHEMLGELFVVIRRTKPRAPDSFAMLRNPRFGIITARRIDIVEPDGTVRLTISNRVDFPGFIRKESAGMLFMSE